MYLFSPYSVEKEYGIPFSYIDITKEYDNLVMNPNIRKTKIKARDLENEISKLQQESGYPYIINIDTANRSNPIDGKIIMSNLCSEILQVQEPSVINGKQEYEVLGTDISCNLGSTNIVNLMDSPDFGKSVRAMTRALTFVTDASDIDVVPSIQNGNALNHTIGLGAMGLHTYFAKNQMEYGSPESLEFTDLYFMLLNYWTLVESNNIAKNGAKCSITLRNQLMRMAAISQTISQGITNQNQTKSKRCSTVSLFLLEKIGPHWQKQSKRRLVPPKPFSRCAKWFYLLYQ